MAANAIQRSWLRLQQEALRATSAAAGRLRRIPPRARHLLTGESGETAALFFLRRNGYIVTARQWKSARYRGDIDLVAWKGGVLCFVEVKTRLSRDERYTAESAVTREKRNTLRRLAGEYVRHVGQKPEALRFDVVAVYGDPGERPEFVLWRGAFGGDWESNSSSYRR